MDPKANRKDKEKIVQFPTLADRDRARKEKIKQEKEFQRQYKKERRPHEPFLKVGNIPPFTKFFALLMVLVNVPLFFLPHIKLQAIYLFGFTPSRFVLETIYTPLTHLILHGDVMHLAFNTVMMLAMGIFFEKMRGTRATIFFFLICGVVGALAFWAMNLNSDMPVIGASGAMSGLFAAVIMAMHDNGNVMRFGRFQSKGPWPILIFWLVLMIAIGVLSGDNIAWQDHVGGFVCGIALFYALQKRWIRF